MTTIARPTQTRAHTLLDVFLCWLLTNVDREALRPIVRRAETSFDEIADAIVAHPELPVSNLEICLTTFLDFAAIEEESA
ncbi:MAG: hypothetical protein M5U01_09450 [Ardenticatenaceae bacterium]|nr:hypothetical protein [Ardenticatenaceae bacterium]